MKWQEIRIQLLAVTCVGVFVTVGKLSLDPDAASHKVAEFTFPADVPLVSGQMLESTPLTGIVQQPRQYDSVIAGRRYRYIQNGIPLDIEMRYIVGTLGNVEDFIKKNTTINLPNGKVFQSLSEQQGIGFYGMFVYQNKAYLSTCINSRGGSTVSTEQFLQNRRNYDLRLSRLQPWLLGQQSLRDRRCLWAHLSTPLNGADPKSAYQVLSKAWFSWYHWWIKRFPQH